MPNRAQKELRSLLMMEKQGETQATNTSKVLEARDDPAIVAPGGEAGFALPEALATAVGAGWLLGPAGGLLLGVAQGILGKREKQNAIDAYAHDMEVLKETGNVFYDEIDRLALTTEDPRNLEQLSAIRAQFDMGAQLSASATADQQAQGMELVAEASKLLNDYAVTNETQEIEERVRVAQAERDLGKTQASQWMSLLDDFDAQSGNYEKTMLAGNQALQMIERGNPVDIVASLIQVNKTLDPTSVVRPEEARALSAGGDLLEQAIRKVEEWAGSGIPMKLDDRKELAELVQGLQKDATAFQMQRDIRFQGRAVKLGLPSDYVQEFRMVDNLPAFKPTGYQENEGELQERTDNVMNWLAENASDQAVMNQISHAVGLEGYVPRSIEEQAKTNPRVARATRRR